MEKLKYGVVVLDNEEEQNIIYKVFFDTIGELKTCLHTDKFWEHVGDNNSVFLKAIDEPEESYSGRDFLCGDFDPTRRLEREQIDYCIEQLFKMAINGEVFLSPWSEMAKWQTYKFSLTVKRTDETGISYTVTNVELAAINEILRLYCKNDDVNELLNDAKYIVQLDVLLNTDGDGTDTVIFSKIISENCLRELTLDEYEEIISKTKYINEDMVDDNCEFSYLLHAAFYEWEKSENEKREASEKSYREWLNVSLEEYERKVEEKRKNYPGCSFKQVMDIIKAVPCDEKKTYESEEARNAIFQRKSWDKDAYIFECGPCNTDAEHAGIRRILSENEIGKLMEEKEINEIDMDILYEPTEEDMEATDWIPLIQ